MKRAESRSMSRRRTALAALVLAALAGSCESSAPSMTDQPAADLLVLNGRVFTADDQGTVAQAVAVSGNTILRVGTNADLAALRGPSTRVIDAHGGIVAPGFNDSHVHFVDGGLSLGKVDLAGATTLAAGPGPDTDIRCRQCRRRVGRRVRLALFAVPWRHPHQSAARCHRRRSSCDDGAAMTVTASG